MNDDHGSEGMTPGQASLPGSPASGGGMAPQRIKTMANLRPLMPPSRHQQEVTSRKKPFGNKTKLLIKKGATKRVLARRVRTLKKKGR